MKIRPNLFFVNEVFEIRVSQLQWLEILKYEQKFQITYSWVTRICVFKFIEKYKKKTIQLTKQIRSEKTLRITLENETNTQNDISNKRKNYHRHSLCLYGNDAIRIRIAAAKLGMTLTQLVRLALHIYLPLLNRNIKPTSLVAMGTKKIKAVVEIPNNYIKQDFDLGDYWPFRPINRINRNYPLSNFIPSF